MTKTKEIADWKKDLQIAAEKVAKAERPAESFISLKGGVMTYQDTAIPNNELECVVVASSFARTCFERPYDPDDNGPPECFANAIDQVDLVPHENVPEPKAGLCTEKACDAAVFGTALQGKGPLCKTRRKLIVMPVSGLADPAEAEIATLSIPPTSSKNWGNYAGKVASSSGLPPWGVKTLVKVRPDPKRQFVVEFSAVEPIEDEATLAGIHGRIAEAEAILLSPYTYEAEEAEAPAKSNKKY